MFASADLPDPVENSQAILDRLRLLLKETDLDFAVQLLGEFKEIAPVALSDLREALAQQELARAMRIAHSLRSNCATFGLLNLARKMLDVEVACRQGQMVPVHSVRDLERDYLTASDELTEALLILREGDD